MSNCRGSMGKMTLLAALAVWSCALPGDPGPFDGTYSGTMVPDKNNSPSCFSAKPRPVHIVVANGNLEYRHFGGASNIKTNVNADGTFSGAGLNPVPSVQSLNGKISGATMEAMTQNPFCKYYLSLTKE